jgi:uncharacterized cupin superfamily protein
MPTIIKPDELEFQHDDTAIEQFDLLTLVPRLSKIVASEHLIFDIRKLEPGKYSFPYHFHRNAEEIILVLSGSMTVRMNKGFEIIQKGQIAFFEIGETGAHQFYNHESASCTYLDIKTNVGIDVCEYPDSGKINISPFNEIFEKHSQVDYNKGEENVQKVWEKLKK